MAAIVLALAVLAFVYGPGLSAQADAGTGFGARIACSCHFVEGRPIGQCRDDFEDGMGLVRLSADDEARTVTASVPLLSSTTMQYREGWGCLKPQD